MRAESASSSLVSCSPFSFKCRERSTETSETAVLDKKLRVFEAEDTGGADHFSRLVRHLRDPRISNAPKCPLPVRRFFCRERRGRPRSLHKWVAELRRRDEYLRELRAATRESEQRLDAARGRLSGLDENTQRVAMVSPFSPLQFWAAVDDEPEEKLLRVEESQERGLRDAAWILG